MCRDFQRFPRFPKDFVVFLGKVYEISVSDGLLGSGTETKNETTLSSILYIRIAERG